METTKSLVTNSRKLSNGGAEALCLISKSTARRDKATSKLRMGLITLVKQKGQFLRRLPTSAKVRANGRRANTICEILCARVLLHNFLMCGRKLLQFLPCFMVTIYNVVLVGHGYKK